MHHKQFDADGCDDGHLLDYGFASGHWGEYFDPPLDHNGKPVKGNGYITDDLTDRAIAFLKANAATSPLRREEGV